jgi:acetyl-CoA carboxylase biotin carboxyl carrier protein
VDRERIEAIVRIAQAAPITELCVREGDLEVRVVKGAAPVPLSAAAGQAPNGAATPALPAADSDAMLVVRADKVGFFHAGKGPGAEPLVTVGDYVHGGQAIATLEALRKLTDITAPACGTIARILVDDGSAVEYGQPLIEIRPKEGADEGAKG